jgi:ABC-type glycerol-3-phosphate transport system substrate-binding protein
MKRTVLVLLALIACLQYAAAKGQSGASGKPGGKETFTAWLTAAYGPDVERYINNFPRLNPDFDVNIVVYPGEDLKTQMRLAVDSGTTPDIMDIYAGTMYSDFQRAGALGDITPLVNKLKLLERINPDYIKLYTTNGKYYAFPIAQLTVYMSLYVNRDLFTKAGITRDPKSFSELISVCTQLKNAGIAPIALGDKDGWPAILLMGDFFAQQVTNMAVVNAVNAGRTKFTNSPELRKALEAVVNLGRSGGYMSGFASMDHTAGIQTFAAGQTAMLYNGSWWTEVTGTTDLGFNLDVITLPLLDGLSDYKSAQMLSDRAYAVNPKSLNKASVEKFLDYITTEEICIYKAQEGGGFSIYPGSNSKVKIDPLFQKAPIQDQFNKPSLGPMFNEAFPTPVVQVLGVVIQQAVAGTITVDQALAQVQAEMDKNLNTMPIFPE